MTFDSTEEVAVELRKCVSEAQQTLKALRERINEMLDPDPQFEDYFVQEEFQKHIDMAPFFATAAFLDFMSPIVVLASPGEASAVMERWDKCARELEDVTSEILKPNAHR